MEDLGNPPPNAIAAVDNEVAQEQKENGDKETVEQLQKGTGKYGFVFNNGRYRN